MKISGLTNNSFGANYSAIIRNQFGLHMAPSAAIAKITATVDKPIFFSINGVNERNVRNSLISIMSLEPSYGKQISVRVADDYPQDVLKSVLDCIQAKDDKELIQILAKYKGKFNILV